MTPYIDVFRTDHRDMHPLAGRAEYTIEIEGVSLAQASVLGEQIKGLIRASINGWNGDGK